MASAVVSRDKMKKLTKIFLGLLTLWPFAYVILFFFVIFSTIVFAPGTGEAGPPPLIALILPLHLLTMLLVMALMVFYIVNVFKNNRVDKDKKVLWAVVLFLGTMIAMPIYWYLYIWKDHAVSHTYGPGQLGASDTSNWVNMENQSAEQQYVPPSQPPDWR